MGRHPPALRVALLAALIAGGVADACDGTETVRPGDADFTVVLRHLGARQPTVTARVVDGEGAAHTKTRRAVPADDPYVHFTGVSPGAFEVEVVLDDETTDRIAQRGEATGGAAAQAWFDVRPDVVHAAPAGTCESAQDCLDDDRLAGCATQVRCMEGGCALTCVDETSEQLFCGSDADCAAAGALFEGAPGPWDCVGGYCRLR